MRLPTLRPQEHRLVNEHFQPALPWVTAGLQSVRDRVLRPTWVLPAPHVRRVELSDGSGDALVVQEHRPRTAQGRAGERPVVVLVHGMGGSAESSYIRASTAGLTAAGYPAARVDLRSSGLSAEHSRQFYHGGRTEDLRDVLAALAPDFPGGLALMGFSLGGNAVLKLVGEPLRGLPVRAAVAVSAPLDLALASEHLAGRTRGLYDRYLLSRLLRDVANSQVELTDAEREQLAKARTLEHFDDAITGPRHGWANAAEYYRVNSCGQFLPLVTVPTLVIHAVDDPMIPFASYEAVDWDGLAASTPVCRAITKHGGHVGFHARGQALPWYVTRTLTHLAAA